MRSNPHSRDRLRGLWPPPNRRAASAVAIVVSFLSLGCGKDDSSRPTQPDPYPDRIPMAARYLEWGVLRFYVSNTGRPLWNTEPTFGVRLGVPGASPQYGEAPLITDMGLWIGATVAAEVRVSATSFFGGDFGPEPLTSSSPVLTYLLMPQDHPGIPDYSLWPVHLGAPSTAGGLPRLIGIRTIWTMYNDRDPARHEVLHGTPLGAVVRETAWMQPGLPSVLFLRFQVQNGSSQSWEGTILGLWADADLGEAHNDLVGCDVPRAMIYTYSDSKKPETAFGTMQPSLGIRLLKTPGDLGLTASAKQWKDANEPVSATQAMNILTGVDIDGRAFVDSTTGAPTKFWASGDPVTHTGFLATRSLDHRMIASTGPVTVPAGTSIDLTIAVLYATSIDPLVSITNLRSLADEVARDSKLWEIE